MTGYRHSREQCNGMAGAQRVITDSVGRLPEREGTPGMEPLGGGQKG